MVEDIVGPPPPPGMVTGGKKTGVPLPALMNLHLQAVLPSNLTSS